MQVISLLTVSRLLIEFLWQSCDCSWEIFPISTLLRCYKIFLDMSSWFKQFYEVRSPPIQTNDRNSNNQIPKDNFILHYLMMQYLSCNNYNNIFSLLFSYLAINLLINFGSTLVTVFCFLFMLYLRIFRVYVTCVKNQIINKLKEGINLLLSNITSLQVKSHIIS